MMGNVRNFDNEVVFVSRSQSKQTTRVSQWCCMLSEAT